MMRHVLKKFVGLLPCGVHTGKSTVMVANMVILPWPSCFKSNGRVSDGSKLRTGVSAHEQCK